jgi:N-acetylmuramoyl-L-alanine amidase
MNRAALLLLVAALAGTSALAQRTDLSGIKICIDPGHGGNNPANDRYVVPDPGIEFWESESNFQKALLLKALLEAKGAWVILTRTTNTYPNDADEPSLSARSQLANDNNVDWFHSIHSNAFNGATNYTLVLLKEDIATRQPAFPEALTMSNIISPEIRKFLRTTSAEVRLDYTFYGGSSGGYNLGVLKNLIMPGQLSEGSFHDYFPETRRLMNNGYRKMEAYAIRNSFLQYYGVPADSRVIVAGIQKDFGTLAPINSSKVRLLPENRLSSGDNYNNGFYLFDSLAAGPLMVRFETPGRYPDSVDLNPTAGSLVLLDRVLQLSAAPAVAWTTPANNDTSVMPNTSISLQFTKPMDTASVRAAFSITPVVSGTTTWGQSNTLLVFKPDSVLQFLVTYTVRIDTPACGTDGKQIDGNGDGVPGDPFTCTFRTRVADVLAPVVVAAYPSDTDTVYTRNQVVNVTFNEPLKPSTVTTTNFVISPVGGRQLGRTVEYSEYGGKGGVTIFPSTPFAGGASYIASVNAVQDLFGNAVTSPVQWTFTVNGTGGSSNVTIDSLNLSVADWWQPKASGSTVGADSATWTAAAGRKIPGALIAGNPASAELKYVWTTGAADYLIREYLSGGAGRLVRFRKAGTILQVYIHGDGSGTEFRFALDDSVDAFPAGTGANHEVSRWIPITWVGWRLVEWDLESDSLGTWLGNGILEGDLRFDSFQIRKAPGGSAMSGLLFFDQLQLATKAVVGLPADEGGTVPETYSLEQNYPNPFNPTTTIRFSLPRAGDVTIRLYDVLGRAVGTVAEGSYQPGTYSVRFDASGLASGTYFYRMEAQGTRLVRKMLVTK